jgi:hypothetical protein
LRNRIEAIEDRCGTHLSAKSAMTGRNSLPSASRFDSSQAASVLQFQKPE